MLKNNRARQTARKPLVDISNGGKPSRCSTKKKSPSDGDAAALDRLLLVRSELSNLVSEIDELIVRALNQKLISRKANQDIDSFRNALSDMHLSLKPWVSRLQQAFGYNLSSAENKLAQSSEKQSTSSINEHRNNALNSNKEAEMDLVVSPSPLVSWRAGTCKFEPERQLFLLTPLPKGNLMRSRNQGSSKPSVKILDDKNDCGDCDDLLKKLELERATNNVPKPCTAGTKNSTSESTSILSFTFSRMATSQQKCAPTDEKIPEVPTEDKDYGEVSNGLTSKYQALLGLQPNNKYTSRREEPDETLSWFLSPPKTCVLMEPTHDEPVPTPINNGMILLTTPFLKDAESTVCRGKQAGESTLKKELWTRFEQVSKDGLHFKASAFKKTARKGFLDMLEEACETTDSDCGAVK